MKLHTCKNKAQRSRSKSVFELAPLYQEENLAIVHNLEIVKILGKVAGSHNIGCSASRKTICSRKQI
jgi:glutamine synthetase type III